MYVHAIVGFLRPLLSLCCVGVAVGQACGRPVQDQDGAVRRDGPADCPDR